MYPLFETAFAGVTEAHARRHRARDGQALRAALRHRVNEPALLVPRRPDRRTDRDADWKNRYIGYPYTKSMNANINVDQSAGLVMTT
ncbi:MAG: hypothetical protein M0C28_31750 [Candidatus Moduliflexus flocculans]|nr:hypothetical protein [Candidatus Moduliflexus flocculans]